MTGNKKKVCYPTLSTVCAQIWYNKVSIRGEKTMDKKTNIIKFRATRQEKCLVDKLAQHHEMKTSELLRYLVAKEAKRKNVKMEACISDRST